MDEPWLAHGYGKVRAGAAAKAALLGEERKLRRRLGDSSGSSIIEDRSTAQALRNFSLVSESRVEVRARLQIFFNRAGELVQPPESRCLLCVLQTRGLQRAAQNG